MWPETRMVAPFVGHLQGSKNGHLGGVKRDIQVGKGDIWVG